MTVQNGSSHHGELLRTFFLSVLVDLTLSVLIFLARCLKPGSILPMDSFSSDHFVVWVKVGLNYLG